MPHLVMLVIYRTERDSGPAVALSMCGSIPQHTRATTWWRDNRLDLRQRRQQSCDRHCHINHELLSCYAQESAASDL